MSVIAIDIGTSSMKAGLFSQEGQPYAVLSSPYPPAPSETERDPEDWFAVGVSLLQKISGIAFDSLKGDPIRCLCVCGNGPSLVAVGEDGKAAMPALLWIDRRAREEARELSENLGSPIDPAFYLPKALWILRNQGSAAGKIRFFMPCPEYLAFRLSGTPHAVLPAQAFSPYIWDDGALAASGLPKELFPPLVAPGTLVGKVDRRIAQLAGLPADCRVASGLPDFMAAQLGSGVVEPGLALDRTGSSEAFNLCAERPYPDGRLLSLPHSVPGLWNVSGGVSTSGSAVAWLEGILRSGESPRTLDSLVPEMEKAGPGSGGLVFLPYLLGERAPLWNPDIRGAIAGLSLSHGRGHIARALLESIAYALREVLEMQEAAGLPCRAVHVTGGASANAFWLKLKADILGRLVMVPVLPEAELSGAAALALAAIGAFPDAREAARSMFRPGRAIDPDPLAASPYEDRYRAFMRTRDALSRSTMPNP